MKYPSLQLCAILRLFCGVWPASDLCQHNILQISKKALKIYDKTLSAIFERNTGSGCRRMVNTLVRLNTWMLTQIGRIMYRITTSTRDFGMKNWKDEVDISRSARMLFGVWHEVLQVWVQILLLRRPPGVEINKGAPNIVWFRSTLGRDWYGKLHFLSTRSNP